MLSQHIHSSLSAGPKTRGSSVFFFRFIRPLKETFTWIRETETNPFPLIMILLFSTKTVKCNPTRYMIRFRIERERGQTWLAWGGQLAYLPTATRRFLLILESLTPHFQEPSFVPPPAAPPTPIRSLPVEVRPTFWEFPVGGRGEEEGLFLFEGEDWFGSRVFCDFDWTRLFLSLCLSVSLFPVSIAHRSLMPPELSSFWKASSLLTTLCNSREFKKRTDF